jgi:mannose-6-phosphate isomerase-like protein (cupin superfamily)
MIRRGEELRSDTVEKRLGGKGKFKVVNILEPEQMRDKASAFSRVVFPPGSSIGYHQHTDDAEVYYIIKGEGQVSDNGTLVTVSAGDMAFCPIGDSHSIENTGHENLEFIALKLLA